MDPRTLVLAACAAILGVAAACSVRGLLRMLAASKEASFPLTEQKVLESTSTAGKKTIYVEAPRASDVSGVTFSVRTPSGQRVQAGKILIPTTVSGLSTVRQSVAEFEIDRAGEYEFLASGVGERAGEWQVYIYTKHTLALIAWIIALTLTGAGALACFVLGLINLDNVAH